MPIFRPNRPHAQRAAPGHATESAAATLLAILERGAMAQPANQRVTHDGDVIVDARQDGAAGWAAVMPMTAPITSLVASDGRAILDPPAADAGQTLGLDIALATSSRTLAAGANLILIEPGLEEIRAGREVLQAERRVTFSTFAPAEFDVFDFDAVPEPEVAVSPLPISDVEIDLDAMTSRAVSFTITRAEQRASDRDRWANELLWSLTEGLGRAVDRTLLDALAALPSNPYTLAKAAAAGAPFDKLRAIVGTTGTGAAAVEGGLFVEGVPAALTPDAAATNVGRWSRAAIAVNSEINVMIERTSKAGGLNVTAWVDMQALIPAPANFWTVAA